MKKVPIRADDGEALGRLKRIPQWPLNLKGMALESELRGEKEEAL